MKQKNSECIFCKIISGKIPCKKVYEDKYTLAIMDIANDVDGHMLVMPKKHINSILDCSNENLAHLMSTVKLVADHCVENCGFDAVNLLNASGESAGQSVPHFHIHIIPRTKDDGTDAWPEFGGGKIGVDAMHEKLKIK